MIKVSNYEEIQKLSTESTYVRYTFVCMMMGESKMLPPVASSHASIAQFVRLKCWVSFWAGWYHARRRLWRLKLLLCSFAGSKCRFDFRWWIDGQVIKGSMRPAMEKNSRRCLVPLVFDRKIDECGLLESGHQHLYIGIDRSQRMACLWRKAICHGKDLVFK